VLVYTYPLVGLAIPQRKKREKEMKLRVVLEPSDEGGYTAYVPSLPGCISEGDTREQAITNIREAIELYLEPVEDDLTPSPNTEITEVAV
jgi:predicted RNase H-like HicB family nuclease